ncbi:unnamed protein product [Ceutorhynchus assimilis]|uniref:HTH psq-type domain-containing protein n=1 Tax=Ceutorhynchus assimilis TaxID=467358 RepID=A0A9N9QQS0_9CUCU|nr:unnamed protein product [Ceutorhynchus assimilis]
MKTILKQKDNKELYNAKLLESSHAWLGPSTSSIAEYPQLLKLKSPTWTQDQLKEAIEAVVQQKMRFTQASSRYGIPKGTLYDNILGKSKRMAVLEEAGLTIQEEAAVLEFCCDVSISPYNRRTKKSLKDVLNFVEKLRRLRDPEFMFTGLSGFRWWWAFSDSYQYQLQSMWQKCWNTNQSLVHNLRFRERGPLKSWRPETMAEAIFSVLKEGLSLSQAARKYDIPYPTFVLYANRVHNMLGPSADGGSDLRPKGRGRPQRILLGVWPDEHIRGVIRAVVFRDSHQIKEEHPAHMAYPRLHDGVKNYPFQDSVAIQNYPNNACSNGSEPNVSPGAAAAAAVAAVAQGLRQQMCSMVAAAHSQSSAHDTNPVASLVNTLALAGHGVPLPSNGAPPMSMSHIASMRSMSSPAGSIQDLRISPSESAGMESPISSPLGLTVSSSMVEPAINMHIGNNMDVGIGSGMTYKPARSFTSPRPENLFQEDIDDLVKPIHQSSTPRSKDTMPSIKMEPMTECRGE